MRDKRVAIRITEEEQKRIKEKADRLDMSLSEYTRFVTLNAEIKVEVNIEK